MLAICYLVMVSEQLKTAQRTAKFLAKSLTDSVLPVPAGPAGAPPSPNFMAVVRVMIHLSVSGVMHNLLFSPWNS